jgi:uncharacterized membrane protein
MTPEWPAQLKAERKFRMRIKRVAGGVAIAGMVGASALGVGAGIANAAPAQQDPAVAAVQPAVVSADSGDGAAVQPVDWHGHGYGHGGYGHGGYGHWGGWYGGPWWHHWGW